MVTSVRHRFTGKRRLEGRLQICFWQSTALTASQTISRALPGAEMRGLLLASRWEPECAYGAVCRAGSTPKNSARLSARSGWLTRFPSASWNAGIRKRKCEDAKHQRGCAGGFMYVNRNKNSRSLNRLTCKSHGNVLRLARLYKRC